jgi:outer membrane protein OmpA-like peptidoglycan-associated protein
MKTQRLFVTILALSLMLNMKVSAQEYLPFLNSNYSGVTGAILQPASIADNRYKVDICLMGLGFSFYNNYASMDKYVLFNRGKMESTRLKYLKDHDYLKLNDNNDLKSIYLNGDIHTMSFMIRLSDKDALAITPRTRFGVNADNITPTLAKLIYDELKDTIFWKTQLENANFSLQQNMWFELDATYGRVILDKQKHFLKGGATLKFLQGIGSGYMFASDLSYRLQSDTVLDLFKSHFNYGLSDNIIDADNNFGYKFITELSLGFDIGFVYEYRPHYEKYMYDMDGKTGLFYNDQEKYLVKVGVSLLDVGRMRYNKAGLSRNFTADIRNWNINNLGIKSPEDLNNVLKEHFITDTLSDQHYFMNLPTAFSAQVDLNLSHGFFVNFSPYIALNKGPKDHEKIHALTNYTFTPRYDGRWFGFFLPFQMNSYKQFNAGIGIHLGELWIGSNDLISLLMGNGYRYGGSGYMMFKIPIVNQPVRDRDNDHVSDRRDKCPNVPGLWAFRGCPDKDGDGIPDANDKCPDIPGIAEMKGCPDTDGDGITDADDDCPDVKGSAFYKGCPDSDGDSIIDKYDECPYQAGLAVFKGCPDTDADGVPDKDDLCPAVAGTPENKGCPVYDTDGDGIKDSDDACPTVPGPVENKGCPLQDTDGDKIPDIYDNCPTIPGIPENKGCPEIKKEEQEVINTAFSSLEFETGKSVIKSVSYESLDRLADLLLKKPDWKLQLSGHTDNVGQPATNLTLSKNRTLAVQNYLVKKGVPANRVKSEWYGQTRPIAPNTTPEGRQKNRRVEIAIFF